MGKGRHTAQYATVAPVPNMSTGNPRVPKRQRHDDTAGTDAPTYKRHDNTASLSDARDRWRHLMRKTVETLKTKTEELRKTQGTTVPPPTAERTQMLNMAIKLVAESETGLAGKSPMQICVGAHVFLMYFAGLITLIFKPPPQCWRSSLFGISAFRVHGNQIEQYREILVFMYDMFDPEGKTDPLGDMGKIQKGLQKVNVTPYTTDKNLEWLGAWLGEKDFVCGGTKHCKCTCPPPGCGSTP